MTAKLVGPNTYSAVIPRQPPFTTVSYRVYATDNGGNTSISEAFAYNVAIPLWLSITVILVLASVVLAAWLYTRRRALPPPPSPEINALTQKTPKRQLYTKSSISTILLFRRNKF